MKALGIDLGTTYSVVATLDDRGRPVVIPNPLGEETTPSVVWFERQGSVVVGGAASNAAPAFPDRTVMLIKRWMGTDRLLTFDDVEYSPEAISGLILRALIDGACPGADHSAPVRAVVTVPAYFGIREREATQQACLLAGIDPLELVSEPVAAAVHYGFSEAVGIGTAVVFDFGGGTFDATILRLGSQIDVIATDGDTELGGADFDDRLTRHLLDQFTVAAAPDSNPAEDAGFMADLALTAERAKRSLSTASTHRVPIRFGGRSATVTVTREDFEAASRDLVDNALACLRRLLATAARAGVAEIDHCLLVGGSSKMPMIAAALTEQFGWRPRLFDPDLAVAKGAALRAHQILRRPVSEKTWVPTGGERVDAADKPVYSVVPHSFGFLVHDSTDASGRRRFIEHVVHQNDTLPVEDRHITLATILDNQASARIEIYEQAGAVESAEVEHNRAVLVGELSGLPAGLKAGSPIDLTLQLSTDGRLSVDAIEPVSGTKLSVEAFIEGVLDGSDRRRVERDLARLTVRL